jgi:hypothetical protein
MRYLYALVLLVMTVSVGCGSGGVPGGDNLGEGTQTLRVVGTVDAENLIANASSENDFRTEFVVWVSRADVDVADALVMLESDGGEVELTWNVDDERYEGSQVGYYRSYILDVSAGDDFVYDVRVEGPDIHTIDAPLAGATVPGNVDLVVDWSRDDQAEVAEVETREMDWIGTVDSGTYAVPAGMLRTEEDKTEEERVRVRRRNQLSPTGGAGGSSFAVQVENEIEFLVAPTP